AVETPPTTIATMEADILLPSEATPDVTAGAGIYAEKCAPCHGALGLGDGPQAADLPNPPIALAAPEVARSAVPAEWYSVVSVGRIERFMPGFVSLTPEERWDVVAYALNLSLTPADLETGAALYGELCAECHAEDGRGMGGVADLAGTGSLTGQSLEDISRTIAQGTGEVMPGFGQDLTEDEIWALAGHVRNLALFSSAEPASAGSPAAGTVAGRVINGTGGAEIPVGLEVTLHGFDDQAEVVTRTTRVDGQGAYAFDEVEDAPGRLFVVTVTYQGVLYGTEIAHMPEAGASTDIPLTIYETTTDPSAARIDRLHLLLQFPSADTVEIVELWLVSNPGDRTVATTEGEGLLQVSLPPGAGKLSFDEGERFRDFPGGFVDTFPLRPGEGSSQLTFSYQLPYPRRLELERTFPLEVAAAVILVPEDGPEVSGPGVIDAGVRQVGEIVLHQYEVGPLPVGEPVALTLAGRPPSASGSGGLSVTPSSVLGGAVLLISLAAAGWWLRRPGGRARKAMPDAAGSRPQEVLAAIARLDEDHEAGRIGEEDYQGRRLELKRRAVELLQRSDD
ncbi:MAG: c-type cytochrome, partial [Anaerolineales bacterium]